MSSDNNNQRLIRLEEKVDKIINNELNHLKEKVAAIDGKLWVVLLVLSGVAISVIFK